MMNPCRLTLKTASVESSSCDSTVRSNVSYHVLNKQGQEESERRADGDERCHFIGFLGTELFKKILKIVFFSPAHAVTKWTFEETATRPSLPPRLATSIQRKEMASQLSNT